METRRFYRHSVIACGNYRIRFEFERINIKHNGIGYCIGLVIGQGAYVYVNRTVPEDSSIDFDDILNDVIPKDFETKKALIDIFEQIVTDMKAMNIPKSVILEIIQK